MNTKTTTILELAVSTKCNWNCFMKEMLYAVRCLKSNEDMILALAGQFKQLSHEPEKIFQVHETIA